MVTVTDQEGYAQQQAKALDQILGLVYALLGLAIVIAILGILAGVTRARETGHGCEMEIAQSDAAASMDWLRSETWRAYERPESEVTGNKSDDYVRRAPGTAGMKEGVRYQCYESADGHVLFMASEQAFWRNFCAGVTRAYTQVLRTASAKAAKRCWSGA